MEPAGGGSGSGVPAALPRARPAAPGRPGRGRVLALAPRGGDEVLGCGGTLALRADQGAAVRVVVAFDGLLGAAAAAEELLPRRTEARAAGRRLGVRDYRFLGAPGESPHEGEALAALAERLAAELEAFRPDAVYAPWIGEPRPDHHGLARAARAALCAGRFRGEAWGYETWTPLGAELVVDVTAAFEQKLQALCAHASRLALADLLHVAAGAAAQRSAALGRGGRQGEAFAPLCAGFPADRDELDLLARLLGAGRLACTSAS